MSDLVRLQMQPVLEKKADGNVDQASRRSTEGQKNDQDAEIEKDAAPNRRGQDVGSGGDGGGLGGGTVNRHLRAICPCWNAGAASYRLKAWFDRGALDRGLGEPSPGHRPRPDRIGAP